MININKKIVFILVYLLITDILKAVPSDIYSGSTINDYTIVKISDKTLVVFYHDGSNICAKKSTDDGTTWTKLDGTEGTEIIVTGSSYKSLSVTVDDSDNMYIVYHGSAYASVPVYFKKLTRSGSTWTIGPQYTVETSAEDRRATPTIAVKEDGSTIWIGYQTAYSSSKNVRIKISTDGGQTWDNAPGLTDGILSATNSANAAGSLLWSNNKLYALNINVSKYRTWDSVNGWSSEVSTPLNGYYNNFRFGAVTSNNNYIHLVGAVDSSNTGHTYFNGITWSSPVQMTTPTSYNAIRGNLITVGEDLWYIRCDGLTESAGNVIYKKCKYSEGPTYTWDSSWTSITSDGINTGVITVNTAEPNLTYLPFVYKSGTASPYTLKFDKIDLQLVVTDVSPSTGSNLNLNTITIIGKGFFGGGTSSDIIDIKLDDSLNTVIDKSSTSITDTTISGAVIPTGVHIGTYNIKVKTNNYGTNAFSSKKFVVTSDSPTITSLSPNNGYNTLPVTITINGTGFYGGTNTSDVNYVRLNTNPVTNITGYSVLSSSVINNVIIPANIEAGTYDVIVNTCPGTTATSANSKYEVKGVPPTVTNVEPSTGPNNGTTNITINGTGFYGGTLSNNVKEIKLSNGALLTMGNVISDSIIQDAIVPAGIAIGTYDIIVRTAAGSNTTSTVKFVVVAGPVVSSVNPNTNSNFNTTTVTITGLNFYGGGSSSAVLSVKLNDYKNTALSDYTVTSDSTIINGIIPCGIRAGTYDVQVTTNVGTNSTSGNKFIVYTNPPTVTDVSPASCYTNFGTTVTIVGAAFFGGTSTSDVKTITIYNSGSEISSYSVVSDTLITNAVVPQGVPVGTYDIRVATYGGENSTSVVKFIVYPPLPVVTSVSPSTVGNNLESTINVYGFNFFGGTGSNNVQNLTLSGPVNQILSWYSVVNDTSILNILTPPGLIPGTYDVLVTTTVGTSLTSSLSKIKVTTNPPVIFDFNPKFGYNTSSTAATLNITGCNFYGGTLSANVTSIELIGPSTISISSFTIISDSVINDVVVPPGKQYGTYNVKIYTGGGYGISSDSFVMLTSPPTVDNVIPNSGVNTSLNTITIYGTGFFGGIGSNSVNAIHLDDDINNILINSFIVDSDTAIRAELPLDIMSGQYNIKVTTAGGTNPTSSVKYYSLIDKNDTKTQIVIKGPIYIEIPPGTFDSDAAITVSDIVTNSTITLADKIKYTNIKIPSSFDDTLREINLFPSSAQFNKGKKANFIFSYTTKTDDPVVEKDFRILWLNNGRWEIVDGNQIVNTVDNKISCDVNHFSIFRIGQFIQVANDLLNVVVYPNPIDFNSVSNGKIKFTNLTRDPTIRIYTISGELVKTILPDTSDNPGNDGKAYWDGRNEEGSLVTRGLYIYLILDEVGNRKIGKFVVK
jgi:hypothetical protein